MYRLSASAIALICLLPAGILSAAESSPATTPSRTFVFGTAPTATGTPVTPDQSYTAERGFGFEPGSSPIAHTTSLVGEKPFLFSVALPEGNYRVTVTLGDATSTSATTIKSESRRLMLENVATAAGQFVTHTFIVNLRNAKVPPPPLNAPGSDHVELNNREDSPANGLVYHWDDKLTLEFNGAHPAVSALAISPAPDVPTLFLVADSTVTDQPREPGASWGQMLPRWFKPVVAVANHAESGETMKSFLTELRLDKVLSLLKRGDYLLIQFGHNDEKASWPQTYAEAGTTYNAYLKVFIAEARRRGATPVLISPVQRRQFGPDGKIRNSHGDYPAAVAQVAREENVPFIDLASISATFYEALGPEKSPLAFSAGGRDATHHNNYGAYELSKAVATALRAQIPTLATALIDDFQPFDPAHPVPPDTFTLAPSPGRTAQAPRGN
jgi:lysophospholipase L1-like esterase